MRIPFFSKPRREFPAPRSFPFIEVVGGESRVLVLPTLGGKIAELWLAGRQWLWSNPVIPLGPGVEGESYVESADSGGMDDCVPTIGACRVPGWVRTFGGAELPEHGELWLQEPDVDVRTSATGHLVRCRWVGMRMPYRFEREIRVDPAGTVHLSWTMHNDTSERMPFVWSAYPLFPLTADTRLMLPEGSRLRVFARHGIDLGEVRSEHKWPVIRGGGKVHDFTDPGAVAKKYACKLFLDVREGEAVLREATHELRLAWNPGEITNVGVWINKKGWTPFRDEEPYLNLGLQPGIGAPDTLVEALGDWKSAAWLDAGASRHWSLRLTGSRLTSVEGGNGSE